MKDELAEQFLHVSVDTKCDLIMKGGIASGLLYPPAILELAKKYRFHQIGGTSAGAIAAAAAAAAEYGRATADQPSLSGKIKGFMQLDQVAQQLAQEGFVFKLFQPSNGTKPLFDTFFDMKDLFFSSPENKPRIPAFLRGIVSVLRKNTAKSFHRGNLHGIGWGMGIALVVMLFMFLTLVYLGTPSLLGNLVTWRGVFIRLLLFGVVFGLIAGGIGWYVGGVIGSIRELITLGQGLMLRDNSLYGICSGSTAENEKTFESLGVPPLTDWLTSTLNELAGLDIDKPLTFEDLAQKNIDLRLVTTNLSEGQPYVFPWEGRSMFHPIFRESDMLKLFPKCIVACMIANSDTLEVSGSKVQLPDGYHFLPYGKKLPVVVATRMSLSFPLLLSAVRLYTLSGPVDGQKSIKAKDLHEHWFSDGGITSNFPIHMFDNWHPAHPTFGIKLHNWLPLASDVTATIKTEENPSVADKIKKTGVYLPQPNATEPVVKPIWQSLEKLPRFLGQIMDTMQNYHDNTQSLLPGYRERIVQVYLTDEEGGLNLNMPPHVIKNMIEKGRKAGKLFTNEPGTSNPDEYFDFEQHRWIRFIELMVQIENVFKSFKANRSHDQLAEDYHKLIDCQLDLQKWYPSMDKSQCEQARKRVKALCGFIGQWNEAVGESDAESFLHYAAQPRAVLRVTPEL